MAIETYSKIRLISMALVLCGERPCTSLSDTRYGVQVGNQLFDLIYETELTSNRWRFAMKKGSLSRLASVPLNQWSYAYQLPTDMLLPIGVYPRVKYEIYGDHLYTDEASVELDYLFKPTITDCPSYFAILLTYSLATNFIKSLTESDTAWQLMQKKYNMERNRAMFADAQGRPSQAIMDSPFVDNR